MMDIEIRGFQAIEHIHVRIDGFAALTGRSNIGKSSVVRAVKAALSGAAGGSFVRHGPLCARRIKNQKTCKCFASVHLKSEGFDLLWEKGDAVNRYVYNNTELTAPNRGFPEFLSNTAFAPVRIGDDLRLLQVSDQFYPIFLLDESGGTIANVLSDVARLDAINVAAKMVEKDRREANSLRKVREKDLAELEGSLTNYEGLDPVLADAQRVEERVAVIHALEEKKGNIERFIASIESIKTRVQNLMGVDAVVAPDLAPVAQKAVKLVQAASFHERITQKAGEARALLGVDTVVIPSSTLADRARALSLLVTFEDKHETRTASVAALDGVETVKPPTGFPGPNRIAEIAQISGWVEKVRAFKTWFDERKAVETSTVPVADPICAKATDLATYADLVKRHDSVYQTVNSLEEAYATVAEEAACALAELQSVRDNLAALGVCPTCALPVDRSGQKEHEHAVVHLPD